MARLLKIVRSLLLFVCILQIAMFGGCNPCPNLVKCRQVAHSQFDHVDCRQINQRLCCQYAVHRVWCLDPPFVGFDWWGGVPFSDRKCVRQRCQ